MSSSSSINSAATPFERATPTSRFELELFREPITSKNPISSSTALTARWRFVVA
jgi:hypothetical protein